MRSTPGDLNCQMMSVAVDIKGRSRMRRGDNFVRIGSHHRHHRSRNPLVRLLAVAFSVVILGVSWAAAQEFRASITGRVRDGSGAPLPAATIAAINLRTSVTVPATPTTDGSYAIPFLLPDRYRIAISHPGFRTYTRELKLEVSQSLVLDVELAVAGPFQAIHVAAETPLLETNRADRGLVISREQVDLLPMIGRNPFMLATLAPGVTYNGQAVFQRPFDNGAIADWSINGGQIRNNEFLLD